MLDSVLLYGGVLLVFAGLLLLIRSRRKGAGVAAIGILAAVTALALPVTEKRVARPATRLDAIMPRWQFDERHQIAIAAPPERVFDAIRKVTAGEILFFRALTSIRRFGRRGPESILNAPEKLPILEVATRTSFKLLADDPPRELVVGTIVIRPRRAVAVMNFLVKPDGHGGSVLSTETRVLAKDAAARRRFAVYWRIIHPGSDIIRRMWLRAIKKRAELSS